MLTPPGSRRCTQLAGPDPSPSCLHSPPTPNGKQELVGLSPHHRHGEDDVPRVEQRLDARLPPDRGRRRRRQAAGHAGGAAPGRATLRPLPVRGDTGTVGDGGHGGRDEAAADRAARAEMDDDVLLAAWCSRRLPPCPPHTLHLALPPVPRQPRPPPHPRVARWHPVVAGAPLLWGTRRYRAAGSSRRQCCPSGRAHSAA